MEHEYEALKSKMLTDWDKLMEIEKNYKLRYQYNELNNNIIHFANDAINYDPKILRKLKLQKLNKTILSIDDIMKPNGIIINGGSVFY